MLSRFELLQDKNLRFGFYGLIEYGEYLNRIVRMAKKTLSELLQNESELQDSTIQLHKTLDIVNTYDTNAHEVFKFLNENEEFDCYEKKQILLEGATPEILMQKKKTAPKQINIITEEDVEKTSILIGIKREINKNFKNEKEFMKYVNKNNLVEKELENRKLKMFEKCEKLANCINDLTADQRETFIKYVISKNQVEEKSKHNAELKKDYVNIIKKYNHIDFNLFMRKEHREYSFQSSIESVERYIKSNYLDEKTILKSDSLISENGIDFTNARLAIYEISTNKKLPMDSIEKLGKQTEQNK